MGGLYKIAWVGIKLDLQDSSLVNCRKVQDIVAEPVELADELVIEGIKHSAQVVKNIISALLFLNDSRFCLSRSDRRRHSKKRLAIRRN